MQVAGRKAGYFPAPLKVLEQIAGAFLEPRLTADSYIVDPCAGEGAAVCKLAEVLGIPMTNIVAAEIDTQRGQALANLASLGLTVAAPCDFLSMNASGNWASIAWCHPPYDAELGGGTRDESRFLLHATRLLVAGGVMLFTAPEHVIGSQPEVQELLMSAYKDILLVPFPEAQRKYREVCVIATRRDEWVEGNKLHWTREAHAFRRFPSAQHIEEIGALNTKVSFDIPAGSAPRRWAKGGLTPDELAIAMHTSQAKKLFAPATPRPQPRPALQLGAPQRALLLAGGFLNRTLEKDGERILIKGSAYKEDFLKDEQTEEVQKKGGGKELKTTRIYSQKICLRVRALDQSGVIHDLR